MSLFLETLPPHGEARNERVREVIAAGIDRVTWFSLTMGRVVLQVSSDWLKIGGARIPMTAANAQLAVDSLDAVLPTPAIVAAIEAAARACDGLVPFDAWPHYSDNSQLERSTILWREANIARRLAGRTPPIVAGAVKDVVLAPFMPAGRVVIFGGLDSQGKRIQPVYPIPGGAPGHGDYFDQGYAGGTRAVRDACLLDGRPAMVADLLSRGMLGGPVARTRYETAPATKPSAPASPAAPRALRTGDSGPAVRELQRLLSLAGWHTRADGVFGAITLAAVKAFQLEHGLEVDGLAGKDTMAALRAAAADAPPDTEPAFYLASAPLPLGDAERVAVFGSFDWVHAPREGEPGAIKILGNWVRENIVTVTIPQLVNVKGCPSGRVTCHRLAVPTFQRFFAAVEKAGKMSLVLTWDGCWNPRLVRGGSSLSNHSWGVDFDINAQWNARGRPGPTAGAHGSVAELVPIAVASGLGWGGNWGTPDAMHFGALRA